MDTKQSIAIVGLGAVFPAASDLQAFWENILAAHDAAREPPPGRWALALEDVYQAGAPRADKVYSKRACFVDDFTPDLAGMQIEDELLAGLDPMFLLLLQAGNRAWRDAVTGNLDRQRVGIIIGNIALPTDAASAIAAELILPVIEQQLFGKPAARQAVDKRNRLVAGLPAGILARALGLGGGSYTLDAACASSLYALKYAVDELQAGRRDAMLCGGLSRPDSLYTQMGFSALHAVSARGRCAPFDRQGDGLVVGEGAGILVLKRLGDALDAGDRIYATIAGVGLANDIGGNLMSPDSEGQLRAMRAAYRLAGWQVSDVDLIECHGTGTPVGDAVEFNSLRTLWGAERNAGDCVIGSVKSNIGHLLTAAGSAGLIKVLLAMQHQQLPPTANFQAAAKGVDLASSPFTVLQQARPWARRDPGTPRRAAISAFGFGGINAHVLLQEWDPQVAASQNSPVVARPAKPTLDAIAIVGMDACFGPWTDLQDFGQRVLGVDGDRVPAPLANSWGVKSAVSGYTLDEVALALGRFRIPPNELKDMLPQQLLMLQVAANALADAGFDADPGSALQDAGVYIGIALDLNTTNYHLRWMLLPLARQWAGELGLQLSETELQDWVTALRDSTWPAMNANRTMGGLGGIVASRIARAFAVGGPSFTLSSEGSSGLRALEAGVRALQLGEIDTAVVGAVDLASDIRALSGVPGDTAAAHVVGDGAAAVILKRHEDARADGDRIYALVRGLGAASGGQVSDRAPAAAAVEIALNCCLADADTAADSIGLVEGNGSAVFNALAKLRNSDAPVATGDVRSAVGHSGAAGALAGLVKAGLCLYHQLLPGRAGGSFFVPAATQYWLRDRALGPRRALLSASSEDGTSLSVILEGSERAAQSVTAVRADGGEVLFSVCANDQYRLIDALQRLRAQVVAGRDLHELARHWWRAEADKQQGALAVSLVASEISELPGLLKQAEDVVLADRSIASDKLYYSHAPLAGAAKLAFVFPGSGSHFIGMGRELGVRWPAVLARLDEENQRLCSQFGGARFWRAADTRGFSHQDYIFGQVWLGAMVSDVIASFGIRPDAVIGYCLGESVGLFATRSWKDRDLMLERMQATRLFTHQLGGTCEAARQTWGLAADEPVDWQLGVVDRPAREVQQALRGRQRVYLLIINTPGECVIGGQRAAVQTLVRDLGCGFHPLEGVTTVHCEVLQPVAKAYRDLHLFATSPPPGLQFFSGIAGGPYQVTRESAADSILGQALHTFDYTRLINTAWEEGVRIFIELGPGASCSRMIGQILGERPHIARSACVKGQGEVGNVLRILAQLNAERVALDLSSLYTARSTPVVPAPRESVRVAVGRKTIVVPTPPGRAVTTEHARTTCERSQPGVQTTRPLVLPVERVAMGNLAGGIDTSAEWLRQAAYTETAKAEVQEVFLRVANGISATMAEAISTQLQLLQSSPGTRAAATGPLPVPTAARERVAFDRDLCMEFAVGSIGRVLGPRFAEVDSFPTRVRLPDEPLMLVDRIIEVEGEACSMTRGRVVTEHDVRAGAWYLDAGRIPTCIAVEAGQADLFLSAYLGIDLQTRGLAVYRLLDAEVCFHGPLPRAGQVIHYDIRIKEFFRQGRTWLFRFEFDGSVEDRPLITMRKGCAGFFSQAELDAGRGIVQSALESRVLAGKTADDWQSPVPMQRESFSDSALAALRRGDLAGCFGGVFNSLRLRQAMGLPDGRMNLVHRILALEPGGGRYGLGSITGEADIHEDAWFLTCHFVDDQVMPGTLMYECCLHTLRVYLLRMGWVGEAEDFVYEPVIGVSSKLKCRGQVLAGTRRVQYEISISEIGYQGNATPYVIADALMSADGRAIVQINAMSLQLSGLSRQGIEATWAAATAATRVEQPRALFDYASINAFAVGKPSVAFGDRYRVFDEKRVIARLPGPPFQFLDRIVSISDCEPWQLAAGAVIEAEYDVPGDAWYFAAERQPLMPFSVLLEIALQPCGWLAAYLGSALKSDIDMSFRNLGGTATQLQGLGRDAGTLRSRVKMTRVAVSGGMIIQNYDFEVHGEQGVVYRGDTYFGFFSKAALADQVGIRDARLHVLTAAEAERGLAFDYPQQAPFPERHMRMIDRIDCFIADGGEQGLGFIRGSAAVDADAWFFKAHFHQDPVWPGSLGLESFMQLLKVVAVKRWGGSAATVFQVMAHGQAHNWLYRGQIIPGDERVSVEASISAVDEEKQLLRAAGFLSVDGRIIYQMRDFALRMTA